VRFAQNTTNLRLVITMSLHTISVNLSVGAFATKMGAGNIKE